MVHDGGDRPRAGVRAASAVRVPAVLAVGDGDEEVPAAPGDRVDRAGRAPDHRRRGLRTQARQPPPGGAPAYGREDRRPTGSRRLPNDPSATWPEFFATQRLLPLADLASEAHALDPADIDRLRRLAGRLDEFEGADEPPAGLGDLWGGNRLVDNRGESWLVDPAAHGGHREFDLATMRLFGGFSAACFAAYRDVFPLAPGWRERVELHQISTLVVQRDQVRRWLRARHVRAIARYA